MNWLDAPMTADCPKCGQQINLRARNFYLGKRTCKACNETTRRVDWKNPKEVDDQLNYTRSIGNLLFDYRGRIRASSFFKLWVTAIIGPACVLGLLPSGGSLAGLYFFAAFIFVGFPSVCKRCQDGGRVMTGFSVLWLSLAIPLFLLLDAFRKRGATGIGGESIGWTEV